MPQLMRRPVGDVPAKYFETSERLSVFGPSLHMGWNQFRYRPPDVATLARVGNRLTE